MMLDDIEASAKREVIQDHMTAEQLADGNALIDNWSNSHSELLALQ